MAKRGQIAGGVVDGPLTFDNAISLQAAQAKNITSPVAGQADILLVPDLEAGNMLAKQLCYLAGVGLRLCDAVERLHERVAEAGPAAGTGGRRRRGGRRQREAGPADGGDRHQPCPGVIDSAAW